MDFPNNEYKEGFLGSYEEPCEVWIDSARVFQNDNCAKIYKGYPSKLSVDYSLWSGTCRLTSYWLAVHSQKWQAYKYCVPIKNDGGGARRCEDADNESYSFSELSSRVLQVNGTDSDQIYTTQFNTSIHPTFFGLRQLDPRKGVVRRDVRATLFVNQLTFADYMSLREIADVIYPGCGNSMVDPTIEPVNVYSAKHLLWRNEDEKFGFYPNTLGPCETWIDNERVQFHGNCVRAYSTYPAKIPVDFSRCRPGRVCELRFYWIAMDTNPLKLMKHCVRVVNDPYQPVAEENTEPHKNITMTDTTSFSVDLTITWEKIWLDDHETLGHSDLESSGTTILVIQ